MKDIQKYLKQYLFHYRSKCDNFEDVDTCNREGGCLCKSVAEMWAYTKALIPDNYVDLSIHDFEGATALSSGTNKNSLPEYEYKKLIDLEAKAKQQVWKYCWGNIPYNADASPADLDIFSVISKRFSAGTNVVIHGTNYYHNNSNNTLKKVRIQKGKSMLASIILKEAIRRKMFENYTASTFEYSSYLILRSLLLDKNDEFKKETVNDLENMDWLLIDDISIDDEGASNNYRRYLKSSLDSFLMARISENKPTIFVMQFDIENEDISREFGPVMDKIISAKDTFIIKV